MAADTHPNDTQETAAERRRHEAQQLHLGRRRLPRLAAIAALLVIKPPVAESSTNGRGKGHGKQ